MSKRTNNKGAYLKFNHDTVKNVREEYNLDKPGAIDQVIDILDDWVKKQEHFEKRHFPRGYLERFIISSKGSVEKAKTKIDKVCTARTMVPHLFEKYQANSDFTELREFYINLAMPSLNTDSNRIYIGKLTSKNITPSAWLASIQHFMIICEYLKLHDYAKGYQVIIDLSDVDIRDLITNMALSDVRNSLIVCTEAYGFRAQCIYVISSSNTINAFITIVKQFVSAKIGNRIHVLKTKESLLEYIPKQYLPQDFGGEQKSILDLYDEFNDVLSSDEHVEHMKEMRRACTNEALRSSESSDHISREYLGMPGSFKSLNLD